MRKKLFDDPIQLVRLLFMTPASFLFTLGFATIFALLASENALSKSKQLAAIESVVSGRSGNNKRIIFLLAIASMLVAVGLAFAGVVVAGAMQQ